MLLQLWQVITNQCRGETIALTTNFELHKQTLSNSTRATTDRVQTHDRLTGYFDNLVRPSAHGGNLFIRRVKPAVSIQIPDDANCRVAGLALDRTQMQLPFEMIGERRRPGQKLFKGWRVFFVLNLLSLVTRIEIILKLAAEVDLLKWIAGRFLTNDLVANGILAQVRASNLGTLAFTLGVSGGRYF